MDANPPDRAGTDENEEAANSRRIGGGSLLRVAVWTVAMLAIFGYLALGEVGAVWYRYNPFLQRVYREVDQRGFIDIWSSWLDFLPEASDEWALSALFVGAIVVVLATTAWGAWLLLVASGSGDSRTARLRDR